MHARNIFIVGVGGIGLSSLAQLLAERGERVSGSDRSESPTTQMLTQKGIRVFIGHDANNLPPDTELLIYSDAVYEDNPERMRAQELGVKQLSYFEALGNITDEYRLIAVAGAHGKTTTTAMITDVLEAGGIDPTVVVGSLRAKTKSNYRSGKGTFFVVEADEFKRHFLYFSPFVLVITNIDADHLDYYKDLADIQSAFRELAQKVPKDGFVVCDFSDGKVAPVVKGLECTVVDYKRYFDPSLSLRVLPLNRVNAAAVLAVADIVKIDQTTAKQALAEFAGTWRRFEYKGKTKNGADVYDDYAHHPLEVKTTLASVREQFPNRKIFVAFHPHLYSRTKILMEDFARAFGDADDVVLAPIFAAREVSDPSVTSSILAQKIRAHGKNAQALDSFDTIESYLREHAGPGDLVLTMGAGDIYKVGEKLIEQTV